MAEDNHCSTTTPKFSRTTTSSAHHTVVKKGRRSGEQAHLTKLRNEVVVPKPDLKEQRKPIHVTLHTQERAARRAGFDDLVASKMYSLELLRKFEEKIQKVIEEKEIKMMRKEMIPRAQLMPLFDRPFLPRRSKRPLTVPKEPRVLSRSCLKENVDPYRLFQKSLLQEMKAIK